MFNDFMFKQTFTLPFKQTKYFQNLIRITIKGQKVIASKHYNCLKQKKRITTKSKIQVLQNKKNQVNDSNKL